MKSSPQQKADASPDDAPQPERKSAANFFTKTIAITSIIISFVTVTFTYLSLRENEKWKKAEFLATQNEKFSREESVIFVKNLMLRNTTFLNSKDTTGITWNEVAILVNDDSTITIDPSQKLTQQALREALDNYLDWLRLFYRYYKNDLFSLAEIEPYVAFHVHTLADTTNGQNRDMRKKLWEYITINNLTEVQELCCLFKHNITPSNACKCSREKTGLVNYLTGRSRGMDSLVQSTGPDGNPDLIWASER